MNRNITATILIVLAVGVYFTVTKNMLADVQAVKAVNDQYTTAIAQADQLVKVRDQVLANYKSLSDDDRARLDRMLPSTVDNVRLVIDLNSVAVKHGFTLKSIQAKANSSTSGPNGAPQPVQSVANSAASAASGSIPNPTLDSVDVSFSVTAPYLQFISFMQDLEADLRVIDITHLSVTGSDNGVYDFGVQMKTYWLRQ